MAPHLSSAAPRGEGELVIRGCAISYEVVGKTGGRTPIVLTPGGGGGKNGLRWLAQKLARLGDRQCLIWDRPNCGASGLTLGDDLRQPEPDMQSDFLHELLGELGMSPAVLLGKSNGARLSLIHAVKYPSDVAGLVLLNVTAGSKAAKRLSSERYFKALDACAAGGMKAVAALDHYRTLFEKNPGNKARLLAMDPARFMTQLKVWGDSLARAGDTAAFPVTALAAPLLARVSQPTQCVFIADEGGGDDGMHTLAAMRGAHAAIPGAAGRPVVVSGDKEVFGDAIAAFVASLPAVLEAPPTPSAAERSRPLRSLLDAYPQLPSAAEVGEFWAYYSKVAAENAAEAEREAASACSFGGALDGLYLWRSGRR